MGAAERYQLIADLRRGEDEDDIFLCAADARVPVIVKRRVPTGESDQEHLSMTIDHARILSAVTHPNVEEMVELGREDDTYFLVLPFLAGQTLDAVTGRAAEEHVAIPLEAKLLIVAELLAGLQAMHDACN